MQKDSELSFSRDPALILRYVLTGSHPNMNGYGVMDNRQFYMAMEL